MKEKLKRDIIKTARTIRKKYHEIKHGKVEEENRLSDTFKSITNPLNELLKKNSYVADDIKIKNDKFVDVTDNRKAENNKIKLIDTSLDSEYHNESDNETFYTPMKLSTSKSELNDWHEYTSKYRNAYGNEDLKDFDTIYGVHLDQSSGVWKIGSSSISINGNAFTINNKSYSATPGLYELLFKKIPKSQSYTQLDLEQYGTILNESNAYRRNFDRNNQVNGNKSYKYTKIIKNLIQKRKGGGLMMELSNKNMDYIYWDDPNELVDRLRLLIASQQAGNNSHNNEIVSIIEELKEANIINI